MSMQRGEEVGFQEKGLHGCTKTKDISVTVLF